MNCLFTNGERYGWRTFEAGVLTSMMGVTLYPMILFANIVDVEIIPTALCMSIGIFMTFSGLVHYYPSPKYIYIGGPLISMLNTLCILMLISLFTGWQIVYRVDMYVGTLVFIGLIMYDTEMMILRGLDATTHDYVMDSLILVLDFINIFVRIVKILLKHTKKDN